MNRLLRKKWRKQGGYPESPKNAIVDSQTVKTTEQGGVRGFSVGKKITGRKRHIIVDSEGLLLTTVVTAAHQDDREGLQTLLGKLSGHFKSLKKIWGDMGYQGERIQQSVRQFARCLEIVKRPPKRFWVPEQVTNVANYLQSIGQSAPSGFQVLPKRWVVERTFAWVGKFRRMAKDYERLTRTTEQMIYAILSRIILKRLAKCGNCI